ncbi:MAG: hypothetical protein M1115_06675 [Actinobacteria bacterium]|nr:hypothetical protein [Actinomycetota bacterium]
MSRDGVRTIARLDYYRAGALSEVSGRRDALQAGVGPGVARGQFGG